MWELCEPVTERVIECVYVCVWGCCVGDLCMLSASGFLRALRYQLGFFPAPLPPFPVLSEIFQIWNQRR